MNTNELQTEYIVDYQSEDGAAEEWQAQLEATLWETLGEVVETCQKEGWTAKLRDVNSNHAGRVDATGTWYLGR